ncbi:MAG TPA: chorismate-binding protein [Phycisphaerae bacterium]|nr:chorismate-binding protein [Phycisphaerae bacterium]HPS52868.1 chorismate-binding protein [Phycisphaerae bacterium]
MKVLIHDALRKEWLEFSEPAEIFHAATPVGVLPALSRAAVVSREKNLPLAGWLSYESAGGINPDLPYRESAFPLVNFAAFQRCMPVTLTAVCRPAAVTWRSELARKDYFEKFSQIRRYIADGETYQVNYTFRMRCDSFDSGMAEKYWLAMIAAQRSRYGSFIETDDWAICSASPELFFSYDGGVVTCRPMKGTAPRGLWPAADERAAAELADSEKNRAENIMIVDMTRNDLGRVAQPGSVEVACLCGLERYPTLWQMVSEIRCRCECGWVDVLKALFPCASITGAPKRRTMQIIDGLETSPRNIYTGTIGFVLPDGRAQFNVAIRTALADKKNATAEYGVGGGIVWDSADCGEYDEAMLKAKVLLRPSPRPELLETLLWEDGGYFLFERHMQRLAASAKYFDYTFKCDSVKKQLTGYAVKNFIAGLRYRVRLVMNEYGKISLEHFRIDGPADSPVRIALADKPINRNDVLLYHKTTSREVYERAKAARDDVDDVLLFNDQNLLTESTISNIVLKIKGRLLTPDISAGLLGGVFRQELIDNGKIQSADLPVELLKNCDEIWLINSVRKWRKAVMVG